MYIPEMLKQVWASCLNHLDDDYNGFEFPNEQKFLNFLEKFRKSGDIVMNDDVYFQFDFLRFEAMGEHSEHYFSLGFIYGVQLMSAAFSTNISMK